jgi:hypothetical protein
VTDQPDEKVRAAGVRTPDRLLGKSTAEIVKQAKREIDSTVRVYKKEWLFEHRGTQQACEDYFAKVYEGRIHPQDKKVELEEWSGDYVLWINKWNVLAEWKDEARANRHAELLTENLGEGADVRAVPRNSRQEHALRAYGTLLLPAAKA